MGVGTRIREVRKAQELTQIEVSKRARIAVNSLRLYEAEKRLPNIEQIVRIADALNCKVEYLLGFGCLPGAAMVQHGKWEKISFCKPGRDAWWRCTLCGRNIRTNRSQDYLYCPKCGAKMDGGVNDV